MLEASYLQEGFAMEVDAQSQNDMEFNVEEGAQADFPVKAGAFPIQHAERRSSCSEFESVGSSHLLDHTEDEILRGPLILQYLSRVR